MVACFSDTTTHTALTRPGTQLQTNPFAKVRKSEKYILESNINKALSIPISPQAAEDQYTLVVIQSTFSLSTSPNFGLVLLFNKIFNFPSDYRLKYQIDHNSPPGPKIIAITLNFNILGNMFLSLAMALAELQTLIQTLFRS